MVEVKQAELLKVSRVAHVVNVWPVPITQAPEPAVAIPIDGGAPELFTAIGMTGADQAHAARDANQQSRQQHAGQQQGRQR